jgi:hypothetical protein
VLIDKLGGTARSGCEVDAKSDNGPGLKPRELPKRSNHSSRLMKREERGERLLRL